MAGFAEWKDKILFWAITALVGGGVGWASWATLKLQDCVTKDEVVEIVQTAAPYVEDRKMIQQQIESSLETRAEFSRTIQRNTDAINALRVQLAKMGNK